MKLVQRLPIPLEVASGVDIASGTQSALLARQKAANDGAERFVGCAHAGLGSLGSGIVAKPDFREKIASSLGHLTDEQRHQLLWGNAEKLYRVEVPTPSLV